MNFNSFLTPEAGVVIIGNWIIVEFIKRQAEFYIPALNTTKLWNRTILPCITVLVSIILTTFIHAENFTDPASYIVFGLILGTITSFFHSSIKHSFRKSNIIEFKDSVRPPKSHSEIPPPPPTGVDNGE
jgi:hypothetical protein